MLNSLATGSAFVLRHWFYGSGGYLPAPVPTAPPPPLTTITTTTTEGEFNICGSEHHAL